MSSKICTQFLIKGATFVVGVVALAGAAQAQYYGYSQPQPYQYQQPYSGAGSYMQPSQQYFQQQEEARRRAQTYYYQPAPPQRQNQDQNQFKYVPELGNYVPTYINRGTAQVLERSAIGCATAGSIGYVTGGPAKGAIYCGAGAFGMSPGQVATHTRRAY